MHQNVRTGPLFHMNFWLEIVQVTHMFWHWIKYLLYGIYRIVSLSILLYCVVLCCVFVMHCIVVFCCCIVLCCVVLCSVLYCIVLYCTALYCIVLFCVMLCCCVVVLYCRPDPFRFFSSLIQTYLLHHHRPRTQLLSPTWRGHCFAVKEIQDSCFLRCHRPECSPL